MEKLKNNLRSIMMIFISSIIVIFLSFFLFLIIYFLKRNFFPGPIIYNEGMSIAFISSVIFIIPILIKKKNNFVFLFLLSFLINYTFIATFPSLIDRSISVMLLKSLQKEKQLSLDEMKSIYNKNYSNYKNFYQVDKRIDEQIRVKNIYLDKNGNYNLSKKGELFLNFTDLIAVIYNLDRSYLIE